MDILKRAFAAFMGMCMAVTLMPYPAFAANTPANAAPDAAGSLVAAVPATQSAGEAYYVAEDGDDDNDDNDDPDGFTYRGERVSTMSATGAVNVSVDGVRSVTAEKLGIGGGGALFDPAISPYDPDDMAVGTDMGGLYVTRDGGTTWAKKDLGRVWDIQYDPIRKGVVYAVGSGVWRSTDYGEHFELMWPKTDDITGEPTKFEDFRSYYFNKDGYSPYSQVVSIAVDRSNDDCIYALAKLDEWSQGVTAHYLVLYQGSYSSGGFEEIARREVDQRGIYRLYDYSKVIVHADGTPWVATQAGIFAHKEGATSGGTNLIPVYAPDVAEYRYAIVDCDQTFDDDGSATYWLAEATEQNNATPTTSLRRFTMDTSGQPVFDDLTVKMNDLASGLDRTEAGGTTYPMRILELAAATPKRAYFYTYVGGVGGNCILARYDDTMETPFRWVYGHPINDTVPDLHELANYSHLEQSYRMWGIATSSANPKVFLLGMHNGAYGSRDCEANNESAAGTYPRSSNIYQLHSTAVASGTVKATSVDNATFKSNGIDNVTTYGLRVDPFDSKHVAQLHTDIGLVLSNDGGDTWSRKETGRGIPGEWFNTVYDLEFDPYIKGRVYSLWSWRNDVPYETRGATDMNYPGGFAVTDVSDDQWKSLHWEWRPAEGDGALPATAIPVKMAVVYPEDATAEAPGGDRTIWVATFNHGLYRSTDSGATFEQVNNSIPVGDGGLVYAADVVASADGSRVFALTARRTDKTEPGCVWAWNGESGAWDKIALPEKVTCPRSLTWDEDTGTLYISCCADNTWTSNGNDPSKPDFANVGGGLYVWKPGDAAASAVDAESAAVGPTCSVEGAAVDAAGNLFASDARGNVWLRRDGAAAFEKVYDRFHVASKGVQLVGESVDTQTGTRTDTLALPSFGGGLLRLGVTLDEVIPDTPEPTGNVYHVSAATGNDANPGTKAAPFRTIAHAASVMVAGDACYVHAGIYREELIDYEHKSSGGVVLSPTIKALEGTAESPITFAAWPLDAGKVKLTGTDPVTNWTVHETLADGSKIWKAPMGWDMYLGRELGSGIALPAGQEDGIANGNLVFAGGKPCVEGRWPNVYETAPTTATAGIPTDIMDYRRYATTKAGTDSTHIVDADMPKDIDLSGAEVWCAAGVAYESYIWLVNSHDQATGTLTLDPLKSAGNPVAYTPNADSNLYYLTRSLNLVDQPGEWYKDVKGETLYLCCGDGEDPNDLLIEAKSRRYAIDLNKSSYVTFEGIDVYGGIVNLASGASHCTLAGADVATPDVCQGPTSYSDGWNHTNGVGRAECVRIAGTANTVTRCNFHEIFGEAVYLEGTGNRFVNNRVHIANIEHSSPAIYEYGRGDTVSHNTVEYVARNAFGGAFADCEIAYNDLSHAMCLSRDGGVVYVNFHDYENSELHHNVIRDSPSYPGNQYSTGLYLDAFTENLIIHHNLIYGIEQPTFDATPDYNHNTYLGEQRHTISFAPFVTHVVIANNTFVNTCPVRIVQWTKDPTPDYSGTLLANNLFRSDCALDGMCDLAWLGFTTTHNLAGTSTYLDVPGGIWDGTQSEKMRTGRGWDLVFRDDFADAAQGDFTLRDGSEAVDGGIAIAGITDGVADGAPDVGAFERGQEPWKAGCGLTDAAIAATGGTSAAKTAPMVNVLPDGDFEQYRTHKWRQTDAAFVSKNWEKSGDVTSYYDSAWAMNGEFSGNGYYVMRLDNGSSLTQTVSGLKPGALYAVEACGRTASDYILGNQAAGAWDKDGAFLGEAPTPQGGIGEARTLLYKGVDFGTAGADQLIVGISGQGLGTTGQDLIVRVRLDDRESGTVAGTLTFDQWRAYGNKREWLTIPFDEVHTGRHDVYLEFDTSLMEEKKAAGENRIVDKIGKGQLYGLLFANSKTSEAVTVTAAAAGGETTTLAFPEGRFARPQRHAYLRTGSDGAVTVTVSKAGDANSTLLGWVDCVALYEVFPEPTDVTLSDANLYACVKAQLDAQGTAYYLGGNSGNTLAMAATDIARVTSLDLSNADISSLAGMENFTGLTSADVTGNHITDFAPLTSTGAAVTGVDEQVDPSTLDPEPSTLDPEPGGGSNSKPGSSAGMGGSSGSKPSGSAEAGGSSSGAGGGSDSKSSGSAGTGEGGSDSKPSGPTETGDDGSDSKSDESSGAGGGSDPKPNGDGAQERKPIGKATVKLSKKRYVYDGKAKEPGVTVVLDGKTLSPEDYLVEYRRNIGAGKATVAVTGWCGFYGTATAAFTIGKATNPLKMSVKKKAVKASIVKSWPYVVRPFLVKKAAGTLKYTKAGGSKYLKLNRATGQVTVKRGTPRGTYELKVRVRASGNANYKPKAATATATIRVR